MKEQIYFEGLVENIIFHNGENGYTVFSAISNDVENLEVVCVGFIAEIAEGENLKMTGSYVVHPTYGKQLNIESYEKTIPSTLLGIEKYLGSGVIKGIGEKLAKKIVKKFALNTFLIMEEAPEKLSLIRGITIEKALSIGAIFHEQAELRKTMIYLQDFGITPVYALKIYKRYKENTVETVKTNPYSLADDIFGIGFKIADDIAFKVGIDKDSPYRIKAGIRHVLNTASNNGNVYLPKELLLSGTRELLQIHSELIENCFIELQIERVIWQEKIENEIVVYLNSFYYAENFVAKKLLELSMNNFKLDKNILAEISEVEERTEITLADNQRTAVIEAMAHGMLVITGGPGTGKTTTINTIINIFKNKELEIELAAPTGRAAKKMSEATKMEAKTIHRLLGIAYLADNNQRQTFDKNEDNPIEADVIIIDETSMVDILLMSSLLKAVSSDTRLILVGDVDQLPSVGPGSVLKDIISSNCIETVRLTEIFRQAQESAIVMNAHKINRGEFPDLNEKEKDFFFMKRPLTENVVSTILELVTERLPNYMDCNSFHDIQVLTPMRKSPIGVHALNAVLQENMNPPDRYKNEKEFRSIVFREGDKVMQIKNNYNLTWQILNARNTVVEEGLGVFNGDEGIIKKINDISESITVVFDENKTVHYDYSQMDELELSYAITIHKSQGSEYKVVVIPIHSGPPMLMSRNLLYTAITRAKKLAVIVGIPETLYKMVENNREVNRYSSLKYRIEKLHDFMRGE